MNAPPAGTVRHDDRRFLAATVTVPVALMLVAGPVLSATSRISGHAVSGGAVGVSPFGFAAVAIGGVATTAAVLVALSHRMPLERPRHAPLPLTLACATVVATLFVGLLPPAAPAAIAAAATLAGIFVGSLGGRAASHALLALEDLPTVATPAPPGAIRHPITRRATAVWAGRMPPGRSTSWLLPIVGIALLLLLVRSSFATTVVFISLPLTVVAHGIAREDRRLRVTIGPSGVQFRNGVTRRLRLSVDIDHVTAASITEVESKRPFNGAFYSSDRQLRIATRPGPALRLTLADDTELIISMVHPAEPAGILNTLLDQRSPC